MNIRTLDNLKIANENTIIKGFLTSNPDLRKCLSNIQLQWDRHQNLLSWLLNWPLLITNLTFDLKIFGNVLSHLHVNYKQDIEDEGDPNLEKSIHLKKSWQVEIWTEVNVIPLNINLSHYNVIDKATSVMSKNVETGIINYVLLY